jgi:phosphoribosyl 1,2-cyclic phosphate phosphodiesterase
LSRALTILGCGSSGGVPRVAQGWGACDPNNPRNQRRRCSALLDRVGPDGKTAVLIDAAVDRLDGVLLTHPHADHTHGIDDLRPLVIAMRKRIEIHMDTPTSVEVAGKFSYVFASPPGSSYPPILREMRLTAGEACAIAGPGGEIETVPFDLDHGDITALGIRFGGLAYTPDLVGIPEKSLPHLEGLDVWIIDALRYATHPSHLSVDQALGWIERMRPRRAILTNLHTDLDYETLRARLPDNVVPAYDGMRIEGF